MKTYTTKEFKKILRLNGYDEIRTKGGHTIYKKGDKTISVNLKLNRMVCRRLIKENDLRED